jgi:amidase
MSAWQQIAQSKRDTIAALLPVEWRLQEVPSPTDAPNATSVIQTALSERELEITESSVLQLLEHLASGEFSAEEVTTAFCHRATIAHQLVCLSNFLPRTRHTGS